MSTRDDDPRDWLGLEERSWRAVWRSFRWSELITAVCAWLWLFTCWLVWRML